MSQSINVIYLIYKEMLQQMKFKNWPRDQDPH